MNTRDEQDGQIADPTNDQADSGFNPDNLEGQISDDPIPDEVSDKMSTTPDDGNGESSNSDEETFNRAYVEDLRKESAGYRTQLRTAQEQLHRLQVEQTGKLADPADLAFDPAHLEDPEALTAAIDALLEAKPHLKRRAFAAGGAEQGAKGNPGGDINLVDLMRGRS